jgi:phenylacetate-CoA ligase
MRPLLACQRFGFRKSRKGINHAVSRVVRFAYSMIPYYRKLFDQRGVNPSLIRTVDDLPLLPLTKRDDIAALTTDEYTDPSADLARCFRHQTSGSSGKPLTLYMRSAELKYRQLLLGRVLWRAVSTFPPIRIAEFGRVMVPGRRIIKRIPGLLTIIKPPGQAHPSEQFRWLETYRPQIVEGFPTVLEILARFCVDEAVRPPKPRVIVSRGETLFPDVRQLLEEVFRTRVMDLYSCQEMGNVAWQCPVDPSLMHINQDGCIVEVVDDQGEPVEKGKVGLITLTNLFNYTTPFIRYVIGDRGRLLPDASAPCACGARGPSMALLDGRADDMLLLPDGCRVSPRVAATLLFRSRPDGSRVRGIHRYQLVQETTDQLVLFAVLEDNVDADWVEVLTSAAQRELGGLHLKIHQVSDIAFEHSGKYKRVVSKL